MALTKEEQQYLNLYGSNIATSENLTNLNQNDNNPTNINNLSKEEIDFLKFTNYGREEYSIDYIRTSSGERNDFPVYKHETSSAKKDLNQRGFEFFGYFLFISTLIIILILNGDKNNKPTA